MTSKQIIKKVEEAVKKFGTYELEDKGLCGVMDTNPIMDDFTEMKPDNIIIILKELKKHKYGETILRDLICDMDDKPYFDALVKADKAFIGIYY